MRIFLAVSILLLAFPCQGFAQQKPAKDSLGFANRLIQQGEYYRAITEYKRLLYYVGPDDHRTRGTAILGVGQALHAGNEYSRAGEWVYQYLDELAGVDRLRDGVELMSRSFLDANAGSRLLEVSDDEVFPESDRVYYRPMALANMGRWEDAKEGFLAVSPDNYHSADAAAHAQLAQNAIDAGWKSPSTAGWLGVIPGLGYLYAGHKQTAFASFIVNTVFWIATYQAFDHDQNVLGGFLAVVSVSWYASNIYGSVQAAKRYNRHLQQSLWSQFSY